MRRLLIPLIAGVVVFAGMVGTAQGAPVPTGCKTAPPSISFKTTVNGVVGVWVTAPPMTCSPASGYTFTYASITAQIAVITPTGSLTYRSSHTVDPSETSLPASFFVAWQGTTPGQTPVRGYRGQVTYNLTGPTGPIHVTHFTTTIWWT